MQAAKVIVGFMPLLDCACIVAAAERGFAAEEGLELALARETSWANIRDRTIIGHFDAAHLLGPMTVASTLGLGHVAVPMIAPVSLGFGGNAITVSMRLWEQMAHEGATRGANPRTQGAALRNVVAGRMRSSREPLTFGMVYPFSCHNYELRYWLAAVGIDPDRDVRLVVIPPPFLVDALRAGQIDGFCVGEPWNSVAVEVGAGAIVAPTTAIWQRSPEKVLGCTEQWAARNPERLAALIRAIYRAAQWCEDRDNHGDLAKLLSEPRYIGAPTELLRQGLANVDFFAPSRGHANFPWISHALWFYEQMVRWGQVEHSDKHLPAVRATYRPDLYRAAVAGLSTDIPIADVRVEKFFDSDS
jgi:ABC-type nitrate/sulfonate/bicarbonate transport system substrate-binding protein